MSLISQERSRNVERGSMSRSPWLILAPWFLSLVYMAFIFYLSAQSDFPLPFTVSVGDFFLHTVEYGILGLLLSWALANSGVVKKLVLYVFLIGLFYGATDEIHQYFIPGRTSSLLDVTADGLGSFLGSYSFHILRSIKATISSL